MATVWITYAWEDNKHKDVDFVAAELEGEGLEVKLDRWNIAAGERLWEQIAYFIEEPSESDAWMLIATANSLASEACKEEVAYALGRALSRRGQKFPVIGLFPESVDSDLIPAAIRTRLFVSMTDPDWKERVKAAVEGRPHKVSKVVIEPYMLHVHHNQQQVSANAIAIEVRPRAGVWAPFFAAIPIEDRESVDPEIMIGPAGVPTVNGGLINWGSAKSSDGAWWMMSAGNQATPTQSYYVWCKKLPSKLAFGVTKSSQASPPQYLVGLS